MIRSTWLLVAAYWWLLHQRDARSLADAPRCPGGGGGGGGDVVSAANGSCAPCDPPDSCWTCVGRVRLTEPSGRIVLYSDNDGAERNDGSCIWLVEPLSRSPGDVLRVTIDDFSTTCGVDYLYAFDGTSALAVQALALTGKLPDDDGSDDTAVSTSEGSFDLTFYSGTALLYFVSNSSLAPSYINVSYTLYNCSGNCSGHGKCAGSGNGSCICDEGWNGADCSLNTCPLNCSGMGVCVKGICDCTGTGFQGPDCATPQHDDLWLRLATGGTPPPGGRASAAAAELDGSVWLHGGYGLCLSGGAAAARSFPPLSPYDGCFGDLANVSGSDGTMYRFNLTSHVWTRVVPEGTAGPSSRYGHSLVAVGRQNILLAYGGTTGQQQQVVGDLWSYNVTYNATPAAWHRLEVDGAVPLTGHTAHMLNDSSMLVLFGYSPSLGYSANVYAITLTRGRALMVLQPAADGSALMRGSYGHASVYDRRAGIIYVYGGYKIGGVASPSSGARASDELLAYDVASSSWSVLRSGPSPTFLHSAVLINRTIAVYGGSCGRGGRSQDNAQCFMSTLMLYDLDCNLWTVARRPGMTRSGRFGHVAVGLNRTMYVIGGFDGRTLSDVLSYVPAASDDGTAWACSNKSSSCGGSNSSRGDGSTSATPSSLLAADVGSLQCSASFPVLESDRSIVCASFSSCLQCLSSSQLNCSWNANGTCSSRCLTSHCTVSGSSCDCVATRDCRSCQQAIGCKYTIGGCANPLKFSRLLRLVCPPQCALATTCDTCTSVLGCSWCSSVNGVGGSGGVCYDPLAFTPTFPYGQCLQIAVNSLQCQAATCGGHQTCAQCLEDPRCGWLDDGSDTGVGLCMDGVATGPLVPVQAISNIGALRPAFGDWQWHFLQCPLCQCNGHSRCPFGNSTCSSCQPPTAGAQCEQCMPGYYGNPINGGNCSECNCRGRANNNQCNPTTGACVCMTRGTVGSRCNVCDTMQRYYGNPDMGVECYYPLTSEYRYTFNFSRADEKQFTRVNLRCLPPLNDSDVDVEITCSPAGASLDFVLDADVYDEPMPLLMSGTGCTSLSRLTYSAKKYMIGQRYNSTFVLTVYNYSIPLTLVVSFTQTGPDQDLFRFFVIFFSCFVALLLVVGIAWRLKLRYNLRRQRQRLQQQRQVMAKRAFAGLCLVLDAKYDAASAATAAPPPRSSPAVPAAGGPQQQQPPLAVQSAASKPSRAAEGVSATNESQTAVVVAQQLLTSHKTAVLSVLIRLPTGNHAYCQAGQYGLAIGSALVTTQHGRRTSSGSSQLKPHCEKPLGSKPKRTSSASSQTAEFTCL